MLSMLLWVTVGRWVYSEAQLSAPVLVPVFDSILEVVRIPTHDTWSLKAVDSAIRDIRERLREGETKMRAVEVLTESDILPRRDFDVF